MTEHDKLLARQEYDCGVTHETVLINANAYFLDSNRITIGNRVLIGLDVKFYCSEHSPDAQKRFAKRKEGSIYVVFTTRPKKLKIFWKYKNSENIGWIVKSSGHNSCNKT